MPQKNSERAIILAATLGMFLSAYDASIVALALPYFLTVRDDISDVSYILTFYSLIVSATIIILGQLSDRFGRIKLLKLGYLTLAVASFTAGACNNYTLLLLSRAIQGLGSAMLMATAVAILTTRLPAAKHKSAITKVSLMLGLGAFMGPPVGGVIINYISVNSIFFTYIPICMIGYYATLKLCKEEKHIKSNCKVDWIGALLFSLALLLLLGSITGLNSLITLAVISLLAFLLWETRAKNPIINLALFKSSSFILASTSTLLVALSVGIALVTPPYILSYLNHEAAWYVGLVVCTFPLGTALASQFSSRYLRHFNEKILMVIGITIMLTSLWGLLNVHLVTQGLYLAPLLFSYGAGLGIYQPASILTFMQTAPPEQQATIGAVNRMLHTGFIAVGVAFGSTLIENTLTTRPEATHIHFEIVWFTGTLLLLIALTAFLLAYIFKKQNS